ncbi:MAG: pyridoxal phosphate-dependent aminotransferase [Myxococcota bacterium]
MVQFSDRIERVEPSPTLAISAKAKAMVADGVDVVSFSAGEPDFNTPEAVREAAKRALDEGKTKYTPAAGIPALREAIARDYNERRGRDVESDQVVVTVGGKQALYNATQVLFDDGQRVVLPSPYWVSYPAQLRLAGAEPVVVDTEIEDDFKMSADQLREAIDEDGVRGLILCSPSNPTGAVYSEEELAEIGEVLRDHDDIVVMYDAMYDRLFYEGEIAPDFVQVNPHLADRTVTFNGFSKTFAMTGWRLGFAIGPKAVISQMSKLQSQSTSNATTFAQYGALEALDLDDSVIAEMRETFKGRRDLIVDGLNDIDGVECQTPHGAFYVFPDVSAHIDGDRFKDDLDLADFLLEEAHVAVVPGKAFGSPGYIRLSYASGEEQIEEGIRRIKDALEG